MNLTTSQVVLMPLVWGPHFDAVYNMRNAGLEEAHAGLKIAGRNISNLRYADDTTLTLATRMET